MLLNAKKRKREKRGEKRGFEWWGSSYEASLLLSSCALRFPTRIYSSPPSPLLFVPLLHSILTIFIPHNHCIHYSLPHPSNDGLAINIPAAVKYTVVNISWCNEEKLKKSTYITGRCLSNWGNVRAKVVIVKTELPPLTSLSFLHHIYYKAPMKLGMCRSYLFCYMLSYLYHKTITFPSFAHICVVIASLLLVLCVGAWAQTPRQKAQALVAQMTQAEKLAMVHGYPLPLFTLQLSFHDYYKIWRKVCGKCTL